MNFETVQPALIALITALTGVQVVQFENEPRLRANGVAAYLSWVSLAGVGVDELRYEDNGATAPDPNLVPVLVGDRVPVLQIAFESWDQRPQSHTQTLATKFRDRIRLPRAIEALKDANLGLIDVSPATKADYRVDDRWISRSLVELRLNATSFERDDDGVWSSIESVDVTDTSLKNVNGNPIPSGLAWNHHVISGS